MTHVHESTDTHHIGLRWTNLGIGPMFNIRHGVMAVPSQDKFQDALETTKDPQILAGLRDGEKFFGAYNIIPLPPQSKIFCKYENRFGDQYRLEVPVIVKPRVIIIEEQLFVAVGDKSNPAWHRVA